MGLIFETGKWIDRLWSEHLAISTGARDLVQQGIMKQGKMFAGFSADIHARLYLPRDPPEIENNAEWAARLHRLAAELGEWAQLRSMCSRNGFAAGIATETLLEQLLPHVPDRPTELAEGASPQVPPGAGQNESPQGPSDPDLRAALRKASRSARDAVQSAEAGLEGMATSLRFSGSSKVRNCGSANLKAIREAHSRLGKSKRLRRIAEIAGRLERLAVAKARSRVRPGVGEVHGVGRGGDLSRLLPSELSALRHPILRRLTLAKLLEQRALTYAMEGKEPCARGPIVILLDESSSMRDGERDIWSKAVALALLATATRQKRAWHLVAFNGGILREVAMPGGKVTYQDIETALDHDCRGGTDFEGPVTRAIDIIHSSPAMHRADVIVVTDGEDSLPTSAIDAANKLTRDEGVSWFIVGVGPDADQCVTSLGPIATSMITIHQTKHDAAAVEAIAL